MNCSSLFGVGTRHTFSSSQNIVKERLEIDKLIYTITHTPVLNWNCADMNLSSRSGLWLSGVVKLVFCLGLKWYNEHSLAFWYSRMNR